MATLKDGDVELDGYIMGDSHPLSIMDFDPDPPSYDVQDFENPVGTGLMMGRDFGRGPSWKFLLGATSTDYAAAQADVRAAAAYWRKIHTTPLAESTLRLRMGGVNRVVFGRPRKFKTSPIFTDHSRLGYTPIETAFQCSTPFLYDDQELTISATLLASSRGGLTAPLRGTLKSVKAGQRDAPITEVGGDAPAPFMATIKGPIANPVLRGEGWVIEVNTSLAFDQSLTIDTRKMTAMRSDGASLAGKLSMNTRLALCQLKPGPTNIQFGGTDPSGRATCTVTWRPTFHGF